MKNNRVIKIVFVTNMCTHYVSYLFELLSKMYSIKFYFTGGHEAYWNKQNLLKMPDIDGQYLEGKIFFSKIKITPGLKCLWMEDFDIFLKTIDDRFALPFVFLSAKILRKPFILWTGIWHHPQTFFHHFSHWITRALYRRSDAIITYGEHVKKYLVALGVPSHKIFCAHHSVDNRIFSRPVSEAQRQETKNRLNVGQGKIILYVGRLEECKGLNFLIEAVSSLKGIAAKLLFIGNGQQRAFLEGLCKASCIDYRFLEFIPNEELYRYYAIADVFVLPSITTKDFKEPWGLVVNEAMNQSCPIIATQAVGAAAGGLVEDGQNGFIVPERDSLAIQKALEVLFRDEALRQRMGQNASAKIESWGPKQAADDFAKAIDFVLGPKAKNK